MNFYFEAAKVLDRLDAKQASIKAVIGSLPERERKRTAALVIETLKYKPVLTDVISTSNLLRDERKITSLNLALVLVHDMILCNGIQAGDGPVKQAVLRHKTRLHSEFQRIKVRLLAKSNLDLIRPTNQLTDRIPRYVRVNTLKWTTDEAIQYFISKGFVLSGPFESSQGFSKDDLISDLLLFSPQVQFHDDLSYKSSKIILQDKASCFPAVVLDPPAKDDAVIIDATAAPGNKTSHLSALMSDKGTLYAFERDKERFSTLQMMIARSGCKNVRPVHIDFLAVKPSDPKFLSVTHILLDPSCSGSGIVNRLDYLLDAEGEHEASEERLNRLACFQLKMVKHAMRFPSVRRIVYSTCSIYPTENEHVVREALNSDEARTGRFKLASRNEVLPAWHRRGLPEEIGCTGDPLSLVRCFPGDDATNGFFVSCFVKDVGENSGHGGIGRIVQKRKMSPSETTIKGGGISRRKRKKAR